MSVADTHQPAELVHPGRVHRSVYLDPDIFEQEIRCIFYRAWVFVGHESQVPEPGDYFCTFIGRQPVVLSRHTDGDIHVLFNRCGHRGAIVCNEERGNTKNFRCMYHGWTYATDGALVGVPLRKGYATDFDLKAEELGMARVPRMQSYRGMVFASLSTEGPDLESHLGAMKSSIDDIVDRAPDGEIQLNNGVFKYSIESNWKILVENSLDSYHAPFTHECTASQNGAQFARTEGDEGGVKLLDKKSAVSNYGDKGVWVFDGGHGYTGALPMSAKASSSPVYREYVALLEARHGPERTREILTPDRHNSMVYPNLVVQSLNYQFRVIRPVAVDRTEVHVYPIRLKGAPEELNRQSIRHVNVTHSPASFIQPEDFEAFERCQRGLEAEGAEWVQFARGLDRKSEDQDKVGLKSDSTHEIQMRNQYRVWLDYMSGSA